MASADLSTGRALARAGLLGNPSDGYGGRVLAITVPEFEATVQITPAAQWDFAELSLFEATVELLRNDHPSLVSEPAAFSFRTTIPRQVGLSGSSALIIAALRALAARAGTEWDRIELARCALAVETDMLGWAAGPQDRVVQAYGGLVDMDFATPWHAPSYVELDSASLPPLFLAWNQHMGTPSTVAHTQVRERWLAGDEIMVQTMLGFADLAVAGRQALDSRTAETAWPSLLERAFELRSRIWNITSADTALVETGTRHGAGVALAGSGGAVVGCPRDPAKLPALRDSYREIGAGFCMITP